MTARPIWGARSKASAKPGAAQMLHLHDGSTCFARDFAHRLADEQQQPGYCSVFDCLPVPSDIHYIETYQYSNCAGLGDNSDAGKPSRGALGSMNILFLREIW